MERLTVSWLVMRGSGLRAHGISFVRRKPVSGKWICLCALMLSCILITLPASATVVYSEDFDEYPTWIVEPPPDGIYVSGGSWLGRWVGPRHMFDYGPNWWQDENGYWCTDGFPYALTPAAGNNASFECDVTISEAMIEAAAGASTVNLNYINVFWNDEAWDYHVGEGYTRLYAGGEVRFRVALKADGTTRIRYRHQYWEPGYSESGVWIDADGTWAAAAGTYNVEINLSGPGRTFGLELNGVPNASGAFNDPVFGEFLRWDYEDCTGFMDLDSGYGPVWDNIVVTQIPEPATIMLLGTGLLLGLAGVVRKEKIKN